MGVQNTHEEGLVDGVRSIERAEDSGECLRQVLDAESGRRLANVSLVFRLDAEVVGHTDDEQSCPENLLVKLLERGLETYVRVPLAAHTRSDA